MDVKSFVKITGANFYTGVPDSLLRPLCDYLMNTYGISENHIVAANEGNCAALAAGHYLATGEITLVYMQNSGLGNMLNPAVSLLHKKVYAVPCMFVVGWRGEPGVPDEPQHIYQGEVTVKLLEDMGIKPFVISADTTENELTEMMEISRPLLADGSSVAFVIRKGALTYENKLQYRNPYPMTRETIIECVTEFSGDDVIISTTGKASRELFEIRERRAQGHGRDFLTVGSMGHSSSIALGVALAKPEKKIWCIDGDGAALMHMGAMAVIGSRKPANLIHIVINNEAHETVGGIPTAAKSAALADIAAACGYPRTETATEKSELEKALRSAKESRELTFIEVKAAIGARKDLGRPTTTTEENRQSFMEYISPTSD